MERDSRPDPKRGQEGHEGLDAPPEQEARPASHEVLSHDEEQTHAIAAALGRALVGGELVAIEGELGVGKTRFVRGLAAGLGVDPHAIASPTFVISQEHRGSRLDLVHMDVWRLGGLEELESIGFDELTARLDSVTAVEWADRIAEALPPERIRVELAHEADGLRRIRLSGPKGVIDAWRRALTGGRCRTCGRPVDVAAPTAPFCSERCRLADLGQWLTEKRRIPGEDGMADDAP